MPPLGNRTFELSFEGGLSRTPKTLLIGPDTDVCFWWPASNGLASAVGLLQHGRDTGSPAGRACNRKIGTGWKQSGWSPWG
jgi:hypothetical protein